jgi:membrane protein DedA with SNARE-associated domain
VLPVHTYPLTRCGTIACVEEPVLRIAAAVKTTFILALAFHLHHRFHGPSIDYWGLAAASAASWIGVPGPGEPVLIATAVIAARHKLDLTGVLLVAWFAATMGGIGGWLLGWRLGRVVVTAPGPFRHHRIRAVERGDQVFHRATVVAVLLTPSWVAGIHKVRSIVYLPTNTFGAAIWAVGIGGAAYLIGPSVIDIVNDLGWVTIGAIVALAVAVVTEELLRRRRRRARERP